MKSGKGSMVSHQMLTELLLRLEDEFRDLPAALNELWWSVGWPGVICLATAAFLGVAILRIKRMYFMSAVDLHREALVLLGDDRGSLKDAEQLLRRAVQQKHYIPARTSLAALYTYRLGRPDDALQLLSPHGGVSPSSSPALSQDEKGIQLDAQAIKAGNGHMILAEIQALEFLSLAYADVVEPALSSSGMPPPTITESKKER